MESADRRLSTNITLVLQFGKSSCKKSPDGVLYIHRKKHNEIAKGLIRMPMSIQDKEAEALSDKSKTIPFTVRDEKEEEMKRTLAAIYEALREKGYNPINQIVGYILSEDPTYITNYKNARSLIRRIDRDELLNALVRNYLGV